MAAPPPQEPPLSPSLRHSQYDAIPMTNRPGAAKVPIPRLPSTQRRNSKSGIRLNNKDSPGPPTEQNKRVPHACNPCRQRKTKCSGERPICKHCIDFKLQCMYGDGKRDRAKNEMAEMKMRVEIYEQLLNQLKDQVDSAGQLAISKALQGLRSSDSGSPMRVEKRDGESLVSADVGSTGSVDHIREDKTSDVWGYMGKSSEISWIQRVAQNLAREARRNSPPLSGEGISTVASSGSQTSSYSTKHGYDSIEDEEYQLGMPAYHLDDLVMTHNMDNTDPYLLPDRVEADALVKSYFNTIHSVYPILNKTTFTEQYEQFFTMFFPPENSKRWLAMLNVIFAIGCLYGRLTNAPWTDGDHLKYFNRARALSLDENIFELADLQQIQVIGLTGMYLLASNKTNRAWNVIGLAVRYAQSLGLNLRNEVPELREDQKELRTRIWFSLYSVEHLLCLITGRPSCIRDNDCSVSLPRPVDEDFCHYQPFEDALRAYSIDVSASTPSSGTSFPSLYTPLSHNTACTPTTSTSRSPAAVLTPPHNMLQTMSISPNALVSTPAMYFLEHVKLTRITNNVLSSLYSPATINHTWSDIQGIISNLELSIQKWRNELPPALSLDLPTHLNGQPSPHRIALAFQYHHARILINRPCLCRLDHRIPNESARSRGFNRSAATTCISAARAIVALIPDHPDPPAFISIAPWWCLLHYFVAAAAILMVEISLRAEHNPQQAEGVLSDSKKVIRWLHAMAPGNMAAERSFTVLSKLLIVSAPKIGGDISDIERHTPTQANVASQHHLHQQQGQRHHQANLHITHAKDTIVATAATEIPFLFRGHFDDPNVIPFGFDMTAQVPVSAFTTSHPALMPQQQSSPRHAPVLPAIPSNSAMVPTATSPTRSSSISTSTTTVTTPTAATITTATASLHHSLLIHSQHPPPSAPVPAPTSQLLPPPISPTSQVLQSSGFSPIDPAELLNHPVHPHQHPHQHQLHFQHTQPSPPRPQLHSPRTQKRLSLGVGNISLPPPPAELRDAWRRGDRSSGAGAGGGLERSLDGKGRKRGNDDG